VFDIYVAWFLHVLITCGLTYNFWVANSKLKKQLELERKNNEKEKEFCGAGTRSCSKS